MYVYYTGTDSHDFQNARVLPVNNFLFSIFISRLSKEERGMVHPSSLSSSGRRCIDRRATRSVPTRHDTRVTTITGSSRERTKVARSFFSLLLFLFLLFRRAASSNTRVQDTFVTER